MDVRPRPMTRRTSFIDESYAAEPLKSFSAPFYEKSAIEDEKHPPPPLLKKHSRLTRTPTKKRFMRRQSGIIPGSEDVVDVVGTTGYQYKTAFTTAVLAVIPGTTRLAVLH